MLKRFCSKKMEVLFSIECKISDIYSFLVSDFMENQGLRSLYKAYTKSYSAKYKKEC